MQSTPLAPGSAANRMTRIRGWVLVVIGVLLAAGMVYAIASQAPLLTDPGTAIDGTTFTGTPALGRAALVLFGAVALLGAAFAGGGVALLRSGRLGKPLVAAIVGAFGLLGAALHYFTSVQ